jgi:vibriolysin
MKVKLTTLAAVVALASSASTMANVNIKTDTLTGTPTFVTGKLGKVTGNDTIKAVKEFLKETPQYHLNGNESFSIKREWVDKLGKRHTHLQQRINGLPVYGTSLIVHTDLGAKKIGLSKQAPASIYAVTGTLAVSKNSGSLSKSLNSTSASSRDVINEAKKFGILKTTPEKAYVYLPLTGETKLVWVVTIEYDNGPDDFGRDMFFLDVNTLAVVTRNAEVYSAKAWKTYDLQNQSQSAAPGVLKCTNTQACGEASAQRAHDGASGVYDYYLSKFNRDSIDGNGMTMISSVHLNNNYNNAFWDGTQMMYGDGDGQLLGDLTLSYDVIAHELTHGVTQHTANLVYKNASGALNEAWSDIMGVSATAYHNGTTQPRWALAVEAYTPNTPGDAMRYMNNPTQDNYSKDWWPDRIPYVSVPSNSNDRGGVHGNSGIANLAYQLLVDGGTHPRNMSSAQVPAIGLAKAEQIFHRAIKTYMTQNTDFAGARSATAQAAQDLYGATEKTAVETAWCAVGVGACPSTTPPAGPVALTNGVAQTGISGAAKAEMFYTLDVPAGATNLTFNTSGGTGDADLFVKFGSDPSTSVYDCNSTTSTSTESCTISNVQAGTYHVMVQAWNQISGVSLTGSYTAGSTGGLQPINQSAANISVGYQSWTRYTSTLPAGYSTLTVTLSGGTGDADLYIRNGVQSTLSSYDCRSWNNGNSETCTINNPASGTWYLDIYGYSAASGVTITFEATP